LLYGKANLCSALYTTNCIGIGRVYRKCDKMLMFLQVFHKIHLQAAILNIQNDGKNDICSSANINTVF